MTRHYKTLKEEEYEGDDPFGGFDPGCIVSTACTSAMNLPDDCEELNVLRRLRDEFVKPLDGGQALIEKYYEIAPGIVTWINQQPDKDEIYARLYSDLVQGTIALFNAGKKAEALQHYRSIVEKLKSAR